jgi:multiple sugar transport system permease protein
MTRIFRQVRLAFIAVPVIVWTCLPVYHMVMLSLTPQTAAFAGRLWPDSPSLENYRSALTRGHPFLAHFWEQLFNSALVAISVCALVLFIASTASFALGRLKPRWAPMISNMALFTYLIPSAFLAIPLYRVMGHYRILNHPWSLILALVAFATPYAIWVMRQYAESVPYELDESARVDGATVPRIFWHIYIPLIAPSLVAIGTYALLLAWNEYLYAFLFLSSEAKLTVPVMLGHFTTSDDAPWTLMMASAVIYSLPPIALYYSVRRFMVTGLTAGSVKS